MQFDDEAFKAGREFGKAHPLSEFQGHSASLALFCECPNHLREFFDVFKYGAHSAWRRGGELPGMIARDLEPGDVFRVVRCKPDPESDRRICLTNDAEKGIRFTFPNKENYWCSVGSHCYVELVKEGQEGD